MHISWKVERVETMSAAIFWNSKSYE